MRLPTLLLCLALLAGACGRSSAATTTTTSAPSTTTTRPTTTTTHPTTTTTTESAEPLSPLTGLPVSGPELLDRRAVVVKIDNHPGARPQTGLPEADMILELPVEGITRLVGVYHSQPVAVAGPVRSIRPTDWQVAALFGAPIVTSGGQKWVIANNRDHGAFIIGEVGSPQTFRSHSRSAPHNLYADIEEIRALADRREVPDDPPTPIWSFGELPPGADGATHIRLKFSGSLVAGWTWDGEHYLRTTNGAVHEWIGADDERSQITVDVLVVLGMNTYLAQPPPGGGVARAVESIGAGDAWIFAGGRVVEGHWKRTSADEGFTLTDLDGDPLSVPPGLSWVSFFPDTEVPEWS